MKLINVIRHKHSINITKNHILENVDLDKLPSFLFHATYKPLLPSIQKYGLIRGHHKNWEDSQNVIYLANSQDIAVSYAETSDSVDEDWLDEIIVFKIRTKDLDLHKLKSDRNVLDGGDTFEYHADIPPEHLIQN